MPIPDRPARTPFPAERAAFERGRPRASRSALISIARLLNPRLGEQAAVLMVDAARDAVERAKAPHA